MNIEVREVHVDDEMFSQILALRYHVYCLERGFENPDDHPGGQESDEYDQHSIHLAAIDLDSQEVVGTMRLIRDTEEKGLPIRNNFELFDHLPEVPSSLVGEISRLAVPKQNRHEFEIIARLFQEISSVSRKYDITHWYAAMAKGLATLLKRRRIVFQPAGPEVDFHGLRTPHFGAVSQILFGSDFYRHYLGYSDVEFSMLKKSASGKVCYR